jgi:hypothetical protein
MFQLQFDHQQALIIIQNQGGYACTMVLDTLYKCLKIVQIRLKQAAYIIKYSTVLCDGSWQFTVTSCYHNATTNPVKINVRDRLCSKIFWLKLRKNHRHFTWRRTYVRTFMAPRHDDFDNSLFPVRWVLRVKKQCLLCTIRADGKETVEHRSKMIDCKRRVSPLKRYKL